MKNTKKSRNPSAWLRIGLPVAIVLVWLAGMGIGGPYFGRIDEVSSNDLASFLPESAEATKVNEQLEKFRDSKAIPAIIVFESGRELTSSDANKLATLNEDLATVAAVEGDISPAIVSDDKKAALVVMPIDSGEELKPVFQDIRKQIDTAKLGLNYKIGGPASFSQDLQKAFGGIDVTLLLVALVTVFVILLVVYRSPILPIIVLITAVAALSVAILVVWQLAKAGIVQLNGQVQGILFILVIGAATDYALLYIARLREELHAKKTTVEATLAALRGSFESILAAGGTVTIGLLCLLLSDLGSNKALGPVGAIGIILAVLAALTLLPAALQLIGRSAFWPRKPSYDNTKVSGYESQHPAWAKVGRLVTRSPRRIWFATTVLLLAACVGIFQLQADGVPQSDLVLGASEARDAQKLIDKHFPGGSGSPVYVLAANKDYEKLVTVLDNDAGVAAVSLVANDSPSGEMPLGKSKKKLEKSIAEAVSIDRTQKLVELRSSLEQELAGAPSFVIDQVYETAAANIPSAETIAAEAYPFKDASPRVEGSSVLLQATLSDPADSGTARETIVRLRDKAKAVDSTALIGGVTAIQYDTIQASLRDQMVIIPTVLVIITLILCLLLRSLVAPIVLLLTTIVSFGSTLGISAILFNSVFGFPGADPSVVLFGFVFLVALGIDYNIFLMTRAREETLKIGVRKGMIKGLIVTGGVITSAGIVLAATFAALGVIPILFLAQLAFIVAFGVLLDTIIVRSLLVPALTLELGKYMWWPSKIPSGKNK